MNWTKLSAALVICLASAAQARAGLFDLFCGHDDCEPVCCAPMYCEPMCCEPMQCEPMCGMPMNCGMPIDCGMPMDCCAPVQHCAPQCYAQPCQPMYCDDDDGCCLTRFFRRLCHDDDECCRPAPCQPVYCEPVACCPQPCQPQRCERDRECCLKRVIRKIWHCEHKKNKWFADRLDMCYPYQEVNYGCYGGGYGGGFGDCGGYPMTYGCAVDAGCYGSYGCGY